MNQETESPPTASDSGPNVSQANTKAEESHHDDSRLIHARREKAQRLREKGVNLYPKRFDPTHTAAAVRENEQALLDSGQTVVMAGRVMLARPMGKAGFFTFLDETGRFQAYVKKDITNDEGFDFFKTGLDIGDIVGVEGKVFVTRRGELTIEARRLTLLTKSMRPLPEKWHGLRDVEQRYRQRYVDLIVNPEVRETFRKRSRIIATFRRILDGRGYIEVETPMMQLIYGGATARPFTTHHNTLDLDLFLRIAPELFLKRLVVGGYERVYEINRNFRNEGLSPRHSPEFSMLELYTAYWDYMDTMELTEQLIRDVTQETLGTTQFTYQGIGVDLSGPFVRAQLLTLTARALGLDEDNHGLRWGMESLSEALDLVREPLSKISPDGADPKALREGVEGADTADQALMFIFEQLVEPNLIEPTFVYDYPKSVCPLAKSAPGDDAVAERFEFFCCRLELANAYSELNDPVEQLARFEDQVRQRAEGNEEAMSEVDMDYIHALEYGLPPASGLGIGMDRFVMLLTDSPTIRDVILFPLMRPPARS